jgi:ubiquinone/menaquinone biosynthesis C-methylase UbiE
MTCGASNMTPLNSRWDSDPEGYDRKRDVWLNRKRDAQVIEFLRDAPAGSRVLEVGSGTGTSLLRVAAAYPHLSFTGLEPLPGYIAYAERSMSGTGLTNVRFVCGRGEDTARLFRDQHPFDYVYSTDVIHHFADEEEAARSIAAVVRHRGSWIAFEPSWLNPYIFAFQARTEGERNFWPRRFGRCARKQGWEVVRRSYMTLIPSFLPDPPEWLKRIEATLEWMPVLAGRVALTLRRQ